MSESAGLWASLLPALVRGLHVSNLRVYLRARGAITPEQQEKLMGLVRLLTPTGLIQASNPPSSVSCIIL